MTAHLRKAFEEASRLSIDQQDALGKWLLAEIQSERDWDELFARSHSQLEKFATEARAEDLAGETQPMTFDP